MSYWEDHCFDPYDDEEEITTTCKYCGEIGLEWVHLPKGWRLFNTDGALHNCRRNDDPAKVFSSSPLDKS